MRLIRSYGHFGPSTLDPWLIRDRAAARASLERILAWDFDRIVMSHGEVVPTGGRELLADAFSFLPRAAGDA
jgi:glyoxylase-like metal-dependent hydrolase (beta-lactamase superfamily II)